MIRREPPLLPHQQGTSQGVGRLGTCQSQKLLPKGVRRSSTSNFSSINTTYLHPNLHRKYVRRTTTTNERCRAEGSRAGGCPHRPEGHCWSCSAVLVTVCN